MNWGRKSGYRGLSLSAISPHHKNIWGEGDREVEKREENGGKGGRSSKKKELTRKTEFRRGLASRGASTLKEGTGANQRNKSKRPYKEQGKVSGKKDKHLVNVAQENGDLPMHS